MLFCNSKFRSYDASTIIFFPLLYYELLHD